MENFNDNIGTRIRDLPACSPVPQPTALPRAPNYCLLFTNFYKNGCEPRNTTGGLANRTVDDTVA